MLLEQGIKALPDTLECPHDLLSSSNYQFVHEDSWMDEYFNESVLQLSLPI